MKKARKITMYEVNEFDWEDNTTLGIFLYKPDAEKEVERLNKKHPYRFGGKNQQNIPKNAECGCVVYCYGYGVFEVEVYNGYTQLKDRNE